MTIALDNRTLCVRKVSSVEEESSFFTSCLLQPTFYMVMAGPPAATLDQKENLWIKAMSINDGGKLHLYTGNIVECPCQL